jgi:Mn2+/Fe2+ NRAMP family transporter
MIAMGIFTLVISLLWIFLTDVGFVSDFETFIGQDWQDYALSNPLEAEIYLITKRLIGVLMFPISVLIILITQKSYRRAETWSWYALLITGAVLWGSLIGYRLSIGYFLFNTPLRASSSMTPIVGLILHIIGVTLPAKAILRTNLHKT